MNRTINVLLGIFVLVALSCNALSRSLPTSVPSTATPEPSNVPTSTPAPTSTPVSTKSPIDFVASIDSNVQDLRFFESGIDGASFDDRVYSTSFNTETVMFIHWELHLNYPQPGQRIDFIIHAIGYKPDESILFEQDMSTFVESDWTGSYHALGWGWKDAGNWKEGTYALALSINNLEIAKGSFQVE